MTTTSTSARTGTDRQSPFVVGDGTNLRARTTSRWRRWRGLVYVLGGLLVVALLAALPEPRSTAEALSPESSSGTGARAVAQILGRHGVDVHLVRSIADARRAVGPGTTVVLATEDGIYTDEQVRAVGALDADLVLLGTTWTSEGIADIGSTYDGGADERTVLQPGCDDADATAAGGIDSRGRVRALGSGDDVVTCYRAPGDDPGEGVMAVTTIRGHRVTVLADAGLVTNAHLASEGNAALALRVLGRQPHLVWLMPSPYALDDGGDGGDGGPGVGDLVPPVVGLLALAALLVVAVAAVWRGRRLGPLVTEPLPVVVRAGETTRGRGRLYRRGRSYGHAAAALRAAAAVRCARRLGLASSASAPQVIDAVALATGRPTDEVAALFYGPPPTDDSALARLAHALDTIESEVHRS
ncbi:DUF4350 domain-containing protein [Cellulomonas sp. HZM]|uniref:DUF4350 domain-containing protein n=1 Tax=Cellulomonas sp. HZM TaxID=1454010 RepID=UPI0004939635|nr:DUF4350 domain-containing protein [Cellulomonas sp. HZM]